MESPPVGPGTAATPGPSGEFSGELTLPGGPGLCVRPIRPAGEACLPRFHAGLSHSSVYQRYFRPIPAAQHARLSHRRGFALRAGAGGEVTAERDLVPSARPD